MAASNKKKSSANSIDPIYQKFSRSIIRTLGSTEFYEFFMDAISRAHNEFQFSNRKVEKLVDLTWVDAIDEALAGFQNIISNPRNIIREDELIVNVAHAKKAGADVVRHLAQHSSMVENFDEETGEVRPAKLMQKFREDSTALYENRLVYTVLEQTYHFVQIRHSALMEAMSEEYGAKLRVNSDLDSAKELIHVDMYVHIKEKEDALEVDNRHREVFDRISRIYRILGTYMNSQFAEQMRKVNRVKGNITRTNILKKNPDYKKIVKLWEFLRQYDEVGYLIKITEQNPHIDERLQQDIFHNIMFQYIILKGYLEDEADRELPRPAKQRKRKMKPKVIKEIIEELTEDYDVPDLEIRKVLIEELTKEQAMLEEKAERDRLIEEYQQRKRAEEERKRKEAEEEAKRLREELEEKERIERQAYMERELEDRRRTGIFLQEIKWFESHRLERMELRREEEEKWNRCEEKSDFADAARQIEEAERRKLEEEERARIREAEAQARKQKMLEEKKERERLALEAEIKRMRKEKEEAQIAKDMKKLEVYLEELKYFQENMAQKKEERKSYEEALKLAEEQARMERQIRLEQMKEKKPKSIWRFGSR